MTDEAETLARRRFMMLNLVRLVSLVAVLTGVAASQGALDLPQPLALVLAIAGLLGFFFGPNLLAKGWRSGEQ